MGDKSEKMNFERVFDDIGVFRRVQIIQYCMLCVATILAGVLSVNLVFLAGTPDFQCNLSNDTIDYIEQKVLINNTYGNNTLVELRKLLKPAMNKKCKAFNASDIKMYTDNSNDTLPFTDVGALAKVILANKESWRESACNSGYYMDPIYFPNTIVTDWQLVCGERYKMSWIKYIFFTGRLIGAVGFGQVSDRFGRVKTFTIVSVMSFLSGIGLMASVNWIMFAVFIFLQGMTQCGYTLTCSVLGTELVGTAKRKWAGTMLHMTYAISFLVIPLFYYVVKDWRYLILTSIVPSFCFIFYYFVLYESPRWLISRGRATDAVKILTKVAKGNGRVLSQETIDGLMQSEEKNDKDVKTYTVLDLFRTPKTALLTVNICFNWVVNSLIYYGLIYNLENMKLNPYVNFAVMGIIEVPALLGNIFLLDRLGRKKLLIGTLCLAGAACLICGFVPKQYVYSIVVIAMIGKLTITMSYALIYFYSSELFPTVVRNLGMGVASMSARVGGSLANPIIDLRKVNDALPMLIFGGLSITASLLSLLFPETMGRPLQQTFDDANSDKKEEVEVGKINGLNGESEPLKAGGDESDAKA